MHKYEVTIPFKNCPWYTGYAEAGSAIAAKALVLTDAHRQGFKGPMGIVKAVEIK